MKKQTLAFFAVLCGLLLSAPAVADPDDGLYAPVAPDGSAFVRFVNATSESEDSVSPNINGKKYKSVDAGEASAYVPTKAGTTELAVGETKANQDLEKGGYYTAVLKGTVLTVLKDQAISSPAKALVSFYNLTGKKLALKTADGKVEVAAAEADKSGYRDINGVPVTLAVYEGDKKLADVGQVVLKRGEATTVLVTEKKDGTVAAAASQATTDTTQ